MIPFILPLLDGWEYYTIDVDSPIDIRGSHVLLEVDSPGFLTYSIIAVDNPDIRVRIVGHGSSGSSNVVDFTIRELYESGSLIWQPRSAYVLRYDDYYNIYVAAYSPIPPLSFRRAKVSLYGNGRLLNSYVEMIVINDRSAFSSSLREVVLGVRDSKPIVW